MPDVVLSVLISRGPLGLPPLEIATGGVYYLAPQFLGASVVWTRQKASSPFIDGEITTGRTRPNVVEQVAVEVRGPDHASMQAAIAELIDAFLQNHFTMTVTVDGGVYKYKCEAADYQTLTWTTPRLVAKQGQVLFQVPRQPVPVLGGV